MADLKLLKPAVDPDMLGYTEEVLARVKSGEVSGILIITQSASGTTITNAGLTNRMLLSGILYHALHKLQSDD